LRSYFYSTFAFVFEKKSKKQR